MAQLQVDQVFKARRTMLALLKRRGFDTTEHEGASISEVNAMLQTKQLDMLITNPTTGRKAYVKFHLGKALRAPNLYDWIEDLFQLERTLETSDDLIVIAREQANAALEQTLREILAQDQIFITAFGIAHLQFNVLDHELVPPHETLTLDREKAMRAKYRITDDSQLPEISRFSPVALAIGLRPGQICEIMRPSRTAIRTPFYRICSA